MPALSFLFIGKVKNKASLTLESEYFERLSHYTSCKMVPVKDSTADTSDARKREESESLRTKVPVGHLIILLDENGKSTSSTGLAKMIQEWDNRSVKGASFIIGGPYGVDDALKKSASLILSLSTLTLPHELARVVLLEQLYRAYTIIRGEKYHHE